MAKLLDPKTPARFVPAGEENKPEAERTAYLLRVPTVADRAALARAVAAAGGRRHYPLQMLAALRAGILALFGADGDAQARDNLLALVDADVDALKAMHEAARAAGDGAEGMAVFEAAHAALLAADAELVEVADLVAQGYPPYARMVGDNAAWPEIHGLVSARLFLVGWENVRGEFRRTPMGVPDEVLAHVPAHHLWQIAAEVERLMRPTEDEEKN